MQLHTSTSACMLKIPNTGSHNTVRTHEDIAHSGTNESCCSCACRSLTQVGWPDFPPKDIIFFFFKDVKSNEHWRSGVYRQEKIPPPSLLLHEFSLSFRVSESTSVCTQVQEDLIWRSKKEKKTQISVTVIWRSRKEKKTQISVTEWLVLVHEWERPHR